MQKISSQSREKEKTALILEKLTAHYPKAGPGLSYSNPFELLVATILSAQTTDEQVNKITKRLFEDLPGPREIAALEPKALEPYLKSLGLYRNKSRFLVETARLLLARFKGQVPDNFEELTTLPGVGRKTANVVLSNAFNVPALAVDTHVFRVARRLGLAKGKTTLLVEEELKLKVPQEQWIKAHHQLIAHGRALCQARKPKCPECFLKKLCQHAEHARESSINHDGKKT